MAHEQLKLWGWYNGEDEWHRATGFLTLVLAALAFSHNLIVAYSLYSHPSRTSTGLCVGNIVACNLVVCIVDGSLHVTAMLASGWSYWEHIAVGTRCFTQALMTIIMLISAAERMISAYNAVKHSAVMSRQRLTVLFAIVWVLTGSAGGVKGYLSSRSLVMAWGWNACECFVLHVLPGILLSLSIFVIHSTTTQRPVALSSSDHPTLSFNLCCCGMRIVTPKKPTILRPTDKRAAKTMCVVFLSQLVVWTTEVILSVTWLVTRAPVNASLLHLVHYITPFLHPIVLQCMSQTFKCKPIFRQAVAVHPAYNFDDVYSGIVTTNAIIEPKVSDPNRMFELPHYLKPKKSSSSRKLDSFRHPRQSASSHQTTAKLSVNEFSCDGARKLSSVSVVSVAYTEDSFDIGCSSSGEISDCYQAPYRSPSLHVHFRHSLLDRGHTKSACSDITITSPKIPKKCSVVSDTSTHCSESFRPKGRPSRESTLTSNNYKTSTDCEIQSNGDFSKCVRVTAWSSSSRSSGNSSGKKTCPAINSCGENGRGHWSKHKNIIIESSSHSDSK